jgi:aryl-alcohol dehydrogenase
MRIQAAVLRVHDQPYRIEPVDLAEPGRGEALVRITAAGMCHTDSVLRQPGYAAICPLPVIPGHEGAGVVEAIGPEVAGVAVGDHVVLTSDSCAACDSCTDGLPAFCDTYVPRNLTGRYLDGSTPVRDVSGEPISARWFQQSSFATHTLATARNMVPVDRDLPLELLAPLSCGVRTGAGAVLNALKVRPGDSIAIFGSGAVGLSAVMAARIAGATTIIAVDQHESRLGLAQELGATHTLLGSGDQVAAEAQPVKYVLDTTGVPTVIGTAINLVRPGGTIALVGMLQGNLTLGQTDLGLGRTVMGVMECHSVPRQFIPRLIELWQQGQFPYDKLIRPYRLSEINEAEKAAQHGDVVKPVLMP